MSERKNLRIALLENNGSQATCISDWIQSTCFSCVTYTTTKEFQRGIRESAYDLVILDCIPFSRSFEPDILFWIRKTLVSNVPVIVITALQSEEAIVRALYAGADDVLTQPVRQHEFLARLSALIRRSIIPETELLSCPPFEINITNRELRLNGTLIELTQKEYDLTQYLFLNHSQVHSRGHLLRSVWGTSAALNTRTVDTHISRLRSKLKLIEQGQWKIASVYMNGYRLEEKSYKPITMPPLRERGPSPVGTLMIA